MLPKLGRHHGGFFPFCFVLSNKLVKQAYRVLYVETVNRMVNLWIKYLFVLSNLPFLIYLHTSTDNVWVFFFFSICREWAGRKNTRNMAGTADEQR